MIVNISMEYEHNMKSSRVCIDSDEASIKLWTTVA